MCIQDSMLNLIATNGFWRQTLADNTDVPQINIQPLSSDVVQTLAIKWKKTIHKQAITIQYHLSSLRGIKSNKVVEDDCPFI